MMVLVTGGTGFIGSELLFRLQARDHHVYSLARYTSRTNKNENRRYEIKQGDIKKASELTEIIRKLQPEVVIHLAALSSVQYIYDHPIENVETNLGGTVNLASSFDLLLCDENQSSLLVVFGSVESSPVWLVGSCCSCA